MNRRNFLTKTATAAPLMLGFPSLQHLPSFLKNQKMGVSVASYAIRWRSDKNQKTYPGFQDAMQLMEHCYEIGAGGIQVGVNNWTEEFSGKIRKRREKLGLFLEGQILLPGKESEIERFETEIQRGKEAGVSIFRTVCLLGRRYENFDSPESFQTFRKNSIQSLEWAEKIVRKHRVKLAVENHKDWRITELIEIIKHLDSEWVGVTLDTGNNLSLLEDPMQVVEALAPYAFTTHFKDMAVQPYEDGFLLSEVPLGEGFLDLAEMIRICKKHKPDITFNLEMITRDPLKIPCLNEDYWKTFDDISGEEFAKLWKTIQQNSSSNLPEVKDRDLQDKLAFEEKNVVDSFSYAETKLALK
ncbi:MAG: sugar phosphate isomerase/epimerase [Bacteroidetes bacterium]|nr:sugar phosphate isomerase/epimerase [Bacteroidota bacterium]